ncbi:MAG: alpha/beta hydrolase [Planctomycetaceae bacterium]|nr:alpha/beta hydrolase [Planctomycetaceae bacterium]
MFTVIILNILLPAFIIFVVTLLLHFAGWVLIFSPRVRACHLFSDTSWLPLRHSEELPDGDEVEFLSADGVTLRGLFVVAQNKIKRGTILFCHELNGNRSNIAPYVEALTLEGFNIFTFDFRNHGKSDFCVKDYHVPWLTAADMFDVNAAIEYVCLRENCNDNSRTNNADKTNDWTENKNDETKIRSSCFEISETERAIATSQNGYGIRIFGLGKGATVALCAAGSDTRVKSLVLDTPTAENQLFNKNCWQALVKSVRLSSRRRSMDFSILLLFCQAVLYSIKQPVSSIYHSWRRYILGIWYDCSFVNVEPIIKNVRQPIMIVHGNSETKIRPHQIRAFCERMPQRPKLWMTTTPQKYNKNTQKNNGIKIISDNCRKSVADFFSETKR